MLHLFLDMDSICVDTLSIIVSFCNSSSASALRGTCKQSLQMFETSAFKTPFQKLWEKKTLSKVDVVSFRSVPEILFMLETIPYQGKSCGKRISKKKLSASGKPPMIEREKENQGSYVLDMCFSGAGMPAYKETYSLIHCLGLDGGLRTMEVVSPLFCSGKVLGKDFVDLGQTIMYCDEGTNPEQIVRLETKYALRGGCMSSRYTDTVMIGHKGGVFSAKAEDDTGSLLRLVKYTMPTRDGEKVIQAFSFGPGSLVFLTDEGRVFQAKIPVRNTLYQTRNFHSLMKTVVLVPGLENIVSVCFKTQYLALDNKGCVFGWGNGNNGELGPKAKNPRVPVLLQGLPKTLAIYPERQCSIFVTQEGCYGLGLVRAFRDPKSRTKKTNTTKPTKIRSGPYTYRYFREDNWAISGV